MSIFDKESKYFIGIDNGVTGSIGIIILKGAVKSSAFIPTPVIDCPNYTKEPSNLKRVDWKNLMENMPLGGMVYIERPMVDPKRFTATQSALRSLEATLVVLEYLGYERDKSYWFLDSKIWQKEFLSSALIGAEEMKKGSMEVGLKLFPSNGQFIKKHGDADGLLIAEFLFRKNIDW
jgi:hypothetical protein